MDRVMSATAPQLVKQLKSLGDPEIAAHSQRFFKTGKGEYGEGDIFLGIRVPVLRAQVKKYRDISLDGTLELLHSRYHEVRLFAVIMLVEKFKRGDDALQTTIYKLYLKHYQQINNWDLVDSSAPKIVGAYLLERDRAILYKMARARNLWQRRIAVLATFTFIGHEQFDDALAIGKLLLNDKEDLIHKAVGWMLREIGKRDQAAEEVFLKQHYQTMPRTMLRYAIEKFPEKRRKAYLKGEV